MRCGHWKMKTNKKAHSCALFQLIEISDILIREGGNYFDQT